MGIEGAMALEFVLKSTVVLAAAGMIDAFWRRGAAARRHALWAVACVMVLLLPLCQGVSPALRLLPRWTVADQKADMRVAEIPHAASPTITAQPATAAAPSATVVTVAEAKHADNARKTTRVVAGNASSAPAFPVFSVAGIVAGVWMAGVLLLLLPVAAMPFFLTMRKGRALVVADDFWRAEGERVRRQLGIRRRITLMHSGECQVPVTFGLVRPVILVPTTALANRAAARVILLHEASHIRRLDGLWHLVARVLCAFYWFHPFAWHAARRLRVESERACDDAVLAAGVRSSDYAQTLMEVAGAGAPSTVAPGVLAMVQRGTLERRIRAILNPAQDRRNINACWTAAIVVCFLCMPPLAMLKAQPATVPAPSESAAENISTGIVVDEAGKPVAGARIDPNIHDVSILTSGNDGRFTFKVPRTGYIYGYSASTEDGRLKAYTKLSFRLDVDKAPKDVRLVLRPSRQLAVTVADDKGAPIAGALVAASASFYTLDQATTDAAGKAVLRLAADAPLDAVVAAKGGAGLDYFLYWTPDAVRNDPYHLDAKELKPVNFVLNGAKAVAFLVKDGAGPPLAGATVTPWYYQKAKKGGMLNIGWQALDRTTDAAGKAQFDFLPDDNQEVITFWTRKEGYTYMSRWEYDPARHPAQIVATMLKQVHVTGRVLTAEGLPAAGATVQANGAGYDEELARINLTTDANGNFATDVDAEKMYEWVAIKDSGISRPLVNVIARSSIPPMELKLEPGQRVHGTLTAGRRREPVSGESVTLQDRDEKKYASLPQAQQTLPRPANARDIRSLFITRNVVTKDNGEFEFYALPGTYSLRAYYQSETQYREVVVKDVEVAADLHSDRSPTAPKEMPGRVTLAEKPETPLAEVVLLLCGDNVDMNFAALDPAAVSDKEGNFTVQRPLGDFYIGGITADRKLGALVHVTANDPRIALALSPTATVKGRIVDKEGKPLGGYLVEWNHSESHLGSHTPNALSGRTTSAPDGTFSIDGLFPGQKYFVMVQRSEREWNMFESETIAPAKPGLTDIGDLKFLPFPNPQNPGSRPAPVPTDLP